MIDEGRLLHHRGFLSSVKKTSETAGERFCSVLGGWQEGWEGACGAIPREKELMAAHEYQGVLRMYGENLKNLTP